MSPTILRIGPYRFFFNSREETRRHVHVAVSGGVAKFWMEPIIALATYYHVSTRDLAHIAELIREHEQTLREAWDEHFGS
jgi:hypothetical protein